MEVQTRFLTLDDAPALLDVYRASAKVPNGFVRTEEEVSPEFIERILKRGCNGGVAIGAFEKASGKLVGSILARKLALRAFSHVLSQVSIGVHPEFLSQGVGRRLLLDFLDHVRSVREDILRVELIARDSNPRQISFYESIGFRREGIFEGRIRLPDGTFEADIPMAWVSDR